MAKPNKTQPTSVDVTEFLNEIDDQQKREDCLAIAALMGRITECEPVMWGPSIVGFGRYRYHYPSGRSGESPIIGFSPRKENLTLYVLSDFDQYQDLLDRLGKHKTGKVCLYIKRLADVDLAVLEELVSRSVAHTHAMYPES